MNTHLRLRLTLRAVVPHHVVRAPLLPHHSRHLSRSAAAVRCDTASSPVRFHVTAEISHRSRRGPSRSSASTLTCHDGEEGIAYSISSSSRPTFTRSSCGGGSDGHGVSQVVGRPGLVVPVLQTDLAEDDSEHGRHHHVEDDSSDRDQVVCRTPEPPRSRSAPGRPGRPVRLDRTIDHSRGQPMISAMRWNQRVYDRSRSPGRSADSRSHQAAAS